MSRVETGSFHNLPAEQRHLMTPLVDFIAEHPKKATLIISAVAGLAIGLAASPLLLPALNNAIQQLSLSLQH